jgi:hypothetical protein
MSIFQQKHELRRKLKKNCWIRGNIEKKNKSKGSRERIWLVYFMNSKDIISVTEKLRKGSSETSAKIIS